MILDEYFDKIFCINLDRSEDRWAHVQEQCRKFGIKTLERFRAYDFEDYKDYPGLGMDNGVTGCTASHAGVLYIAGQLPPHHRILVLEDDFEIVYDDFDSRLRETLRHIPDNWDLFYIGGQYGDTPKARIDAHVIRCGNMLMTSSYAIRSEHARRIAPSLVGSHPADAVISRFADTYNHYCIQPRLMIQAKGRSIIMNQEKDYRGCMTDGYHESLV